MLLPTGDTPDQRLALDPQIAGGRAAPRQHGVPAPTSPTRTGPEVASKLRKDAANLARAVVDMPDALDPERGKGPQVVRVERVVVNEGRTAAPGVDAAADDRAGRKHPDGLSPDERSRRMGMRWEACSFGAVQRSGGSCRHSKHRLWIGNASNRWPNSTTERSVVDRTTNLKQEVGAVAGTISSAGTCSFAD